MEIINLTMKEATNYVIERIMDEFSFNKKTATVMFKSAITYNVVIDEIVNQVGFITDSVE